VLGDGARSFLRDDPRPEQVAHVRRHRIDLPFVAVEPDHVVTAAFIRPEVTIDARRELRCLALEPKGELIVAGERAGELCDAELRVVNVALDLTGRDRQVRDRAVGELNSVP
jgi:hypothetical protein